MALTRRRILGLLGLTGAATVVGAQPAAATSAGTLAGTFTDLSGNVTDLSGQVTMTAPEGTVDILGATAVPRIVEWSTIYGQTHDGDLVVDRHVWVTRDVTVNGHLTVTATGVIHGVEGTLRVRGSVLLDGGRLEVDQPDPTKVFRLRMLGTREADYLGASGGGTHLTDRGLWMQDGATTSLVGARRTAYTRATGGLTAGQTVLTVEDATGWRAGDRLIICPTEPVTVSSHWNHYDRPTVQSVAGNTVTLTAPLTYNHPAVTDPVDGAVHGAEIANETNNIVIEGDTEANPVGVTDTDGRAVVHIHDGAGVQTWRNVTFRHFGPQRRFVSTTGKTLGEPILGRYAVHFHRNGTASAGTSLTDVVIADCGSRGFVPHGTHDITCRRLVVHAAHQNGLWWDTGDPVLDATHRLLVEDSLISQVKPMLGGNLDASLSGVFFSWTGLGPDRATIRRCTVVGVQGSGQAGGLSWAEATNDTQGGGNGAWVTQQVRVHNNRLNGVSVWHNTATRHVLESVHSYRNGLNGFRHGAYRNSYLYTDIRGWDNGDSDLKLLAASGTGRDGERLEFRGGRVGTVSLVEHKLPAASTGLLAGVAIAGLVVDEINGGNNNEGLYDFVDCGLTPATVQVVEMHPASVIRVQTGGQAWRFDAAHPTGQPIAPFA